MCVDGAGGVGFRDAFAGTAPVRVAEQLNVLAEDVSRARTLGLTACLHRCPPDQCLLDRCIGLWITAPADDVQGAYVFGDFVLHAFGYAVDGASRALPTPSASG